MNLHPSVILLDTNVFKKIIKKDHEKFYRNLFDSIEVHLNPEKVGMNYRTMRTPILTLEYLGQVPEDIPEEKFDLEQIGKIKWESPAYVFKRALEIYNASDLYTVDKLRAKNNEQIAYNSALFPHKTRDKIV